MHFTPAVYEHAAALIARTPWQVSRDGELLHQAHSAAYRRYGHSPVIVGIDIYNPEAEAYGAIVAEPAGNAVPAIAEHPCKDLAAILAMPPLDPSRDGRLPMVLDAAMELAADLPDADVRVPVSGPFSLAAGLMGIEPLLMECIAAPAAVRMALEHLAAGQVAFCRAAAAAGVGVALFESAATPPLLSPSQFRQIELPALEQLSAAGSQVLGRRAPCILGGNAEPVLDALLETDPPYVICPSETDQAAFMARIAARPEVMVRVNMNPAIVAAGSPADIRHEVNRVVALALGRTRVCLGSGVLPYETPPENVDLIREYLGNQ